MVEMKLIPPEPDGQQHLVSDENPALREEVLDLVRYNAVLRAEEEKAREDLDAADLALPRAHMLSPDSSPLEHSLGATVDALHRGSQPCWSPSLPYLTSVVLQQPEPAAAAVLAMAAQRLADLIDPIPEMPRLDRVEDFRDQAMQLQMTTADPARELPGPFRAASAKMHLDVDFRRGHTVPLMIWGLSRLNACIGDRFRGAIREEYSLEQAWFQNRLLVFGGMTPCQVAIRRHAFRVTCFSYSLFACAVLTDPGQVPDMPPGSCGDPDA